MYLVLEVGLLATADLAVFAGFDGLDALGDLFGHHRPRQHPRDRLIAADRQTVHDVRHGVLALERRHEPANRHRLIPTGRAECVAQRFVQARGRQVEVARSQKDTEIT